MRLFIYPFSINFYFNKNDEQDEKNVIIEDVEIDHDIEEENDKVKEEETKVKGDQYIEFISYFVISYSINEIIN